MGFRDAEWAYNLPDLEMREKVVLTALCHRTDDKTHQTFVGQQTIAEMVSSSPDFVRRGLRELERLGVIQRKRRTGAGGYRTSDLTTVDTAYTAASLEGATPSRPGTYKADSRNLTGSEPLPTQTTAGAEEITQGYHSEDHPVSPAEAFERAWKHWPKKVEKRDSKIAFEKATRSRSVAELEHDVCRFGQAYARSASEVRFVPALSSWLRKERWTDDLPVPPLKGARESVDDRNLAVVASLQAAECAAGRHKLTVDNTCALCDVRPWQLELPEGVNF